jgi:hypothetical protein
MVPPALKFYSRMVHLNLLITDIGLPGGMNSRQVAESRAGDTPRSEGFVHNRICRECRHRTWASRRRNAGDGQAFRSCDGSAGQQGARANGKLNCRTAAYGFLAQLSGE